MDGMKKLMAVTGAILIAAAVFAILANVTKTDLQNQIKENSGKPDTSAGQSVNSIDQDFVFFSYSSDPSFTNTANGFLIDKDGKRYDYSVKEDSLNPSPEKTFKDVINQFDNLNGTDFITGTEMENLYISLSAIRSDIEYTTENMGTENGTTTVFGIKYKEGIPQLVKIYSYGDQSESPNDANAVSIQNFFTIKLTTREES